MKAQRAENPFEKPESGRKERARNAQDTGMDAACTDSDNGADLIHAAAEGMGVRCPGEISLIGFGNITPLKNRHGGSES